MSGIEEGDMGFEMMIMIIANMMMMINDDDDYGNDDYDEDDILTNYDKINLSREQVMIRFTFEVSGIEEGDMRVSRAQAFNLGRVTTMTMMMMLTLAMFKSVNFIQTLSIKYSYLC